MWEQPVWVAPHHPSLCLLRAQRQHPSPPRPPLPSLTVLVPTPSLSPVLLEAVGCRDHPAVSDEGAPTDVSAPDLEAGLPWPLTLRRHGPAHNAARGALETTVWGWGKRAGVDGGGGPVEGSETQTETQKGVGIEGEQRKEVEGRNEGQEWGERQAGSRQGGKGRIERQTDKW